VRWIFLEWRSIARLTARLLNSRTWDIIYSECCNTINLDNIIKFLSSQTSDKCHQFMDELTKRQQLLLEQLKTSRALSVEEIQRRFAISTATAYRDFRALVEVGAAVKTQGGIRLAVTQAPAGASAQRCSFCGGELNERSSFIIQGKDGRQLKACCAHCGLMALGNQEVAAALTCDFLYGRMVNARQAVFLLESSVSLCCQPSVLSFASASDAERFQAGFGGQVCTLEEALARLRSVMHI